MGRPVARAFCLILLTIGLLSGCKRDDPRDIQLRLNQWFQVGIQVYFDSKARCTVAAYNLRSLEPRETLTVSDHPKKAMQAFREGEVVAIRMEKFSPDDLTNSMLLDGDGAFGKEALRAGARSVDCMKGTFVEGHLRIALTRKGALMVFDKKTEGVVVLDQVQERLYFLAGDVL